MMSQECLEVVFPFDFSPPESWCAIEKAMVKQGIDEETYGIDAADCKHFALRNIREYLQRTNAAHYGVTGRHYTFRHSSSGGYNLDFVLITQSEHARPADWDRWVEPFFEHADKLISARILDDDFEWWQIARDPESYKLAGRDYNHLPMRWNDLPAPLGQYEIDTSRNPGRRLLRDGYVEAVGATMWLGQLFSERTGCDLAAVKEAQWLRTEELTGGVLRLEAQRECFKTAEGEEGELQERLRRLLFPKSFDRS